MRGSFLKNFDDLYKSRFVLFLFVRQFLVIRYRRTLLGYLWTLVSPLLMMSVMTLIFSSIQKIEPATFAVFLFSGMIPWICFNNMVLQSSVAFINNEALIKKIYIPKIIFPLSISIGVLIDSLLSFFALLLIMLCLGVSPSVSWIFIPVCFIFLFVFSFGISLILSVLTVFFRDLQHILAIFMQAMFFLSPILYKKGHLSGLGEWIVSWNPIVPFIDLFRVILNDGNFPPVNMIMTVMLISLFSFFMGLWILFSKQSAIVFRL